MNITSPKISFLRSSILWADKSTDELPKWQQPLHFFIRLLCIVIKEVQTNDLSLRSGALTYTILLSLVPLLAFSTAAVKGLGGGNHLRDAAYSYLEAFDPGAKVQSGESTHTVKTPSHEFSGSTTASLPEQSESLTTHLRTAVDTLFDYVDRTDFATLGTIGMAGMVVSIILVLGHIEAAMNTIWKVKAGRSIARKIADYLTLLIMMPISINVAFAASAFLKNPTLAAKINLLIPFPWMQTLLLKALPIFFITATFHIVYLFFPNTKVKTIPSLVGALLAATLWFMVQNVYISLQIGVARYNAIYGSFATLPLFLVWIYLCWLFILIGAQFSYALQNFKSYRLAVLKITPALELSAAIDIMAMLYKNFQEQIPLTSAELKELLPQYSAELVDKVVGALGHHGLLHFSNVDERLLPAVSEESFQKQAVISAILGDASVNGQGSILAQKALAAAKATL